MEIKSVQDDIFNSEAKCMAVFENAECYNDNGVDGPVSSKYCNELLNCVEREIVYEPVDFIFHYCGLDDKYTYYTSYLDLDASSFKKEVYDFFMSRPRYCKKETQDELADRIILRDNALYFVPKNDFVELSTRKSPCIINLLFSDDQLSRLALDENSELYLENGVRLIDEINRLVLKEKCGAKIGMLRLNIPFYKNKQVTINSNDVKFADILCKYYLANDKFEQNRNNGCFGFNEYEYIRIVNSNNANSVLALQDVLNLNQIFMATSSCKKINFFINCSFLESNYVYDHYDKQFCVNSTNDYFETNFLGDPFFIQHLKSKYLKLGDLKGIDISDVVNDGYFRKIDNMKTMGLLELDVKDGLFSEENIISLYKQISINNCYLKMFDYRSRTTITEETYRTYDNVTVNPYSAEGNFVLIPYTKTFLYSNFSERRVPVVFECTAVVEDMKRYNEIVEKIERFEEVQSDVVNLLSELYNTNYNKFLGDNHFGDIERRRYTEVIKVLSRKKLNM